MKNSRKGGWIWNNDLPIWNRAQHTKKPRNPNPKKRIYHQSWNLKNLQLELHQSCKAPRNRRHPKDLLWFRKRLGSTLKKQKAAPIRFPKRNHPLRQLKSRRKQSHSPLFPKSFQPKSKGNLNLASLCQHLYRQNQPLNNRRKKRLLNFNSARFGLFELVW